MTGRRVLVGLIGANILKSLSPALHADAFAAAGIDGYYHMMDVEVLRGRSLVQLLDAAKTAGFAGTNVTFPFKQEVLALLDELDDEARQIGALNCVTIAPDGRTKGYNTDRSGFRQSFEHHLGRASAEGACVALVGAGGAGRAVAFALMDIGVADLAIHDSNERQSASLIADLHKYFGAKRARAADDLAKAVAAADGVVNATPVGMLGIPGNPVPADALRREHWAADVIYTPLDTEFIKAAKARGARTLTGGGMCVYQAVEAFRLFTGIAPDVERMHKTFLRALAARDAALAAQS
ncbi:MAG TPA: shikimate dehydrogenase [Pseudolabrys sp.]|nr:shikimate dehydrogenase [Pseudolabrys sp.]